MLRFFLVYLNIGVILIFLEGIYMRALIAKNAVCFNEKEYTDFVKNVESRKISKEREQELKMVSKRFNQAKKLHGETSLKGLLVVK